MSFAGDYGDGYRVKFVDIRVNPPGGRRKAAARTRACAHKGCDHEGACKAPREGAARATLTGAAVEYYWFCERHAAEYNRTYNFFDGLSEAEIAAYQAAAAFGHKKTWKMGAGPMGGARAGAAFNPRRWKGRAFFEEGDDVAPQPEKPAAPGRTRLQTRALEELNLPHDATSEAVRERYFELVKRFHPDSNGGDRSMEHRLQAVIKAFRTLKVAGLA